MIVVHEDDLAPKHSRFYAIDAETYDGADNVFDVYPDRNLNPGNPTTSNGGISNFGIFPYNGISPFGFNGRFIYFKLGFGL